MAKVSIQQVEDFGFRPEQYNQPDDWDEADTGYVARVIAEASAWVSRRIGADAYAVGSGPQHEYAAAAEFCRVRAEMWKRRAAFIDANAVSSLGNLAYLERREFEAQAARALECAEENIALAIGGNVAPACTGVALVAAISGPFAGGVC